MYDGEGRGNLMESGQCKMWADTTILRWIMSEMIQEIISSIREKLKYSFNYSNTMQLAK